MLLELDIRDFAIIDHVQMGLGPGFNVVTGETGAGKSIVVDSVGLLLGDRADISLVRAGADRAVITGLFEPGGNAARLTELLDEYGLSLEAGEPLIVVRELHAAGRSVARINGQAVPVRALSELGALLIDVHGQSDNASLKREAEHLGLLDRFGRLEAERVELSERVRACRAIEQRLASLQRDEEAQQRRVDLLRFALDEIEAARLEPGETAALKAERSRLANAERLARAAEAAYGLLQGGLEASEEMAGLDLVDRAVGEAESLARIDPEQAELFELLSSAAEGLREAAARLRDYRESLEFNAERLEEVEERLALIASLERKHRVESVEALLDFAARAAEELGDIEGADARIAELEAERETLLAEIGRRAGALSAGRRAAAARMARALEAELEALSMAGSRFEVALEARPDEAGAPVEGEGFEPGRRYAFDESGADRAAFLVSMNPGEPTRPLVKVASGGETARLMLALKGILGRADELPTLIFDEIDAGIGGRVGSVVGQKLWALASGHQVLCVTHLPQVAAYGDSHYRVAKAVEGGRTTTRVRRVEAGERVEELMQMLGAETSIARENALQLLQHGEQWKLAERGQPA